MNILLAIATTAYIACTNCAGTGYIELVCPQCNGKGTIHKAPEENNPTVEKVVETALTKEQCKTLYESIFKTSNGLKERLISEYKNLNEKGKENSARVEELRAELASFDMRMEMFRTCYSSFESQLDTAKNEDIAQIESELTRFLKSQQGEIVKAEAKIEKLLRHK